MSFFKAALAILYVIFLGYGFIRLVLREKRIFSIYGLIPMAFVAGFSLLAFWANLIMLARLRMSFWLLTLPLCPLFIYGASGINWRFEPDQLLYKIKNVKWFEWLLILVIIFGAGSIFLMSAVFPMNSYWDSRVIWAMKAKMLFGDGTIFSPNFMDPFRIQPHFRYPLLFPLAQSFIYFALGEVDDWAVMLLIGLFFPLLVMFLFALLQQATGERGKALLGAAALAVMPLFFMSDGPAHSGYADTPLALFFLVSFGLIFLWRQMKDDRLLILGCCLSAFLPLVKNEGSILWLLNMIWAVWPERISLEKEVWRKVGRNLVFMLLVAIVVVGPWLVLSSNIPNVQDENYAGRLGLNSFAQNIGRVPVIISFFLSGLLGTQAAMTGSKYLWGALWLLVLLAVIRAVRRRDPWGLALFCTLALFCVFMIPIYVIAPYGGADYGMVSNFFRLMMPITPLAIMLVAMQAERPALTFWLETESKKDKRKKEKHKKNKGLD